MGRKRSFHEDPTGRRAFTLIELLVVVSVVALLLALLFPALSRARKQARAVACQVNLKQWGLRFAAFASENDGCLRTSDKTVNSPEFWVSWSDASYTGNRSLDARLCPMASTPANNVKGAHKDVMRAISYQDGGTFRAWGPYFPSVYRSYYGSYGMNPWHLWTQIDRPVPIEGWHTTDVRGASRVPVLLDSATLWTGAGGNDEHDAPPQRDAVPVTARDTTQRSCINRHNGGVNALFLDWSVRKVGLKELWTLKWHPNYDTAGPWTKAGGAKREDWPEWLRRFKEY